MHGLDEVDSRTVLYRYHQIAFALGIALVIYPWPMPAAWTGATFSHASMWSFVLLLSACFAWLSAWVAIGFAKVEDALTRTKALRHLGIVLALAGAIPGIQGFGFWDRVPAEFNWVPIGTGLVLVYFSLARRRRRVAAPAGTVVFHEKASLRGRFEESIRQAARQEERARLARDLHDAVKQQLFVVQTAAATVEQRFEADPDGARDALAQVRASARDALTEMEAMLEQLQAAPITNAGLIAALRRQCDVLAFRTGADVRFEPGDLPPEPAFAPGAHQAMLRFAQEALANVARHARASHVTITLSREGPHAALTVTDDGQGFDLLQARGMGLTNMAARAAEAGGTSTLKSTPGEGTTVSLLLEPYAPDRRKFLNWTIGATILMVWFAVILFRSGPGAVVPIVIGEAVFATVMIDNALAWWRARRWP